MSLLVWDFGLCSAEHITKKMLSYPRLSNPTPAIWLGEHPTVVTLGIRSSNNPPIDSALPTLAVARGGLTTLHLPGQLMFYPLVRLNEHGLQVRSWVSLLEDCVIKTLSAFGGYGLRCHGEPGVYLPQGKVAAIGIKIINGWSTFGLCLNISCPLAPYKKIIPCGLSNRPITSMYASGLHSVKMSDVKHVICQNFQDLIKKI